MKKNYEKSSGCKQRLWFVAPTKTHKAYMLPFLTLMFQPSRQLLAYDLVEATGDYGITYLNKGS